MNRKKSVPIFQCNFNSILSTFLILEETIFEKYDIFKTGLNLRPFYVMDSAVFICNVSRG